MQYHVSRDGQTYGPYTLEDLQRYIAAGNVLPTDMARSDEMPDWVPVSQIVGTVPGTPAVYQPPPVAGYAPALGEAPAYPAGAAAYPDPPNLHWVLVLVISIFCGFFFIVWEVVQAAWMRRVNPRSNALFLYIAGWVILIGGTFLRMTLMFSSGITRPYWALGGLISLITLVLLIMARFDMRRSMEEHFNGPEPIGLSLSGVMTFFFGALYFQYHFTRINEMKRLARYRGVAI